MTSRIHRGFHRIGVLADYIDDHRWRAERDLRTLGRLGARPRGSDA